MRMRRLGISSAALVLAAAVVSSGCADQTFAARVGDDTVTEDELIDEVEARAPVAQGPTEGRLDGSWNQQFVGQVLQDRIFFTLVEQVLDEEGVDITDEDRAQLRQRIEQRAGAMFAELPAWYQDLFVEDQARLARFNELPPDEAETALLDLVERTDIEVNRRFGTWEPNRVAAALAGQDRALRPPEGPAPQPDGDGGGSGGSGGAGGPGGGQGPGRSAESGGSAGSAGSAVE